MSKKIKAQRKDRPYKTIPCGIEDKTKVLEYVADKLDSEIHSAYIEDPISSEQEQFPEESWVVAITLLESGDEFDFLPKLGKFVRLKYVPEDRKASIEDEVARQLTTMLLRKK